MLRLLSVFILVLPLSAIAQLPEVPEEKPTAQNHGPVQMSESRDCVSFPYGGLSRNAHGTAKFSMIVGLDGAVRDIGMTLSSGDNELDQASYKCVKSRTYEPAFKNGQPVEFTLQTIVTYSVQGFHSGFVRYFGDIVWNSPHSISASVLASGEISSSVLGCIRATPDIRAKAALADAKTGLTISYAAGEIDHVTVVSSSGDVELDKIALDCFSAVSKNAVRARMLGKTRFSTFSVPWKTLFSSGAG